MFDPNAFYSKPVVDPENEPPLTAPTEGYDQPEEEFVGTTPYAVADAESSLKVSDVAMLASSDVDIHMNVENLAEKEELSEGECLGSIPPPVASTTSTSAITTSEPMTMMVADTKPSVFEPDKELDYRMIEGTPEAAVVLSGAALNEDGHFTVDIMHQNEDITSDSNNAEPSEAQVTEVNDYAMEETDANAETELGIEHVVPTSNIAMVDTPAREEDPNSMEVDEANAEPETAAKTEDELSSSSSPVMHQMSEVIDTGDLTTHPPHVTQPNPTIEVTMTRAAVPPHKTPPPAPTPAHQTWNSNGFGSAGIRELRVEDALNYLDQVKVEFGSAPRIYNEFLEIMKHFKAAEIDTPGVIMRVSELFSGYNNLILGFNTFLPDGFKISLKDLQEGGKYCRAPRRLDNEPVPHHPSYPGQQPHIQPQPQPTSLPQKSIHRPVSTQHPQPPIHTAAVHDQDQGGPPATVEFDHAISYVTTIKRRFANEPRTYQQFLEILHTYQKEQRGIREVLEQVSSLFADHPDLLKQFTYFLPEAVQEQAKERLHAAAAEAEARQAAASKQQMYQSSLNQQMPYIIGKKSKPEIIDMTRSTVVQKSPEQAAPIVTMQYSVVPEAVVYNAAVERQYFDMAKEALKESTRDGETWNQFVKCMDLYAQEILTKSELLRYMEDLLGKQHADLYEEFKRILNAAGAAGAPGSVSHDDSWHSVPLADIDFKRCRRCTPSYRALPRDYPAAQFSGRSEEESNLLNDVWISIPDGNEETYTFRHMRKNQHEENLFRVEDERFEIDMVIDSTATALKRLEAIAEEIAFLQQKESFSNKFSITSSDDKMKALSSGGLGGKIIKYSFDKHILTTIHKHAIARIYGDAGQDMLDLLYKNPVVAVPVIVKRLSQKLKDFLDARDVLNVRWMEVAQLNYYKSFDHRSLTWRTVDKRLTSTRTLLSEIKDRAANEGYESDATIQSNKNKAKEDYGSFYHATMGKFIPRKMDLQNMPKPAPSMFTPHLSMVFENNSLVQRDVYRILSFALERSTSPVDKERSHRIWLDFLAPFLGLSTIWMQSPAVAYAAKPHHTEPVVVSAGEESVNDDEDSSDEENEMVGDMHVTEEVMQTHRTKEEEEADVGFSLLDNQPIPTGVTILTVYGEGTVISFNSLDKSYVVGLPFGTAYLNRNAVLCTVLPLDRFPGLQEDMDTTDEEGLERDSDKMMLGPQSLYLFFRLHQLLVHRLNIARNLAFTVDKEPSLCTLIDHMDPEGSMTVGQKRYDAFLGLIYELIEGGYNTSAGGSEGGKYEDRLRSLLGHNSYELSTLDKLLYHALKHLQQLAIDDTFQGMIQIFRKQMEKSCFKPVAFRQEAAMISEGETVYAFQYCQIPHTDNSIMHIEMLGCITDASCDDDSAGDERESLTADISLEGPPATKKARR